MDKTPPKVEMASPANLTNGVSRGANVRATFTRTDGPSLDHRGDLQALQVPLHLLLLLLLLLLQLRDPETYQPYPRRERGRLECDPREPYGVSTTKLSAKTKYRGVISTRVKDMAGTALDQSLDRHPITTGNQQRVWYFTTGSQSDIGGGRGPEHISFRSLFTRVRGRGVLQSASVHAIR